jgi:DNA topoisomerase-1
VRSSLKESHYKLYKLIWERFVASQMTDAQWDATAVLVSGQDHKGELVFKATGRVLVFDGHYRVTGVPNASEEAVLPAVEEGKELGALQIDPIQSFTSPPPRYTEASLVRKLEAEGIGRPSTYAQIIQVIQNRKYVEKVRNRFYATDLGKVVTDKLMEAFPEIMQVGYTRDMEQQLDDIEDKHADWVEMLRRFYGPFTDNLQSAYNDLVHAKAETQPASYTCPQCGGQTVYRFGKKGRFLSCARYPKCKFAAPVDREGHPVAPEQTDIACPRCGSPMLLRRGRFGLFLSCERYPECSGIVNLDKKGLIAAPKIPPLPTGLSCPKCDAPMNLRRGARGPWLSCSKFPKCRGRIGWATLEEAERTSLEAALQTHEKENPLAAVRKTDGTAVSEGYKPQPLSAGGENADENGARAE